MKAYGKRKAAYTKRQIMIVSAITTSCVAILILYQTLSRSRGILTDLFKKVCDTIIPRGEKSGDDSDMEYRDTVFEENTGDSYEI